ncbi:MAG: signal peptidase II [Rubrobacteraceae bacterium]
MNRTSNIGSALAIAFGVFIVDRVLKLAVESFMRVGESVTIVPGLLRLTYVTNPGGAFGTLPGQGVLLMAGSLLALGVVAYILFTDRISRLTGAGAGLVLGGTVGNLFDRVVSGQVTDYLSLFYVFNAADFAIIAGVGALLTAALRGQAAGRGRGSADT